MTIQTKHFIEFSDILAVRLECRNEKCRATICLVLAKDAEFEFAKIRVCPNCAKPWFVIPGGSTIEPGVKACIESIKNTIVAIEAWKEQMKGCGYPGFSLALEIKSEIVQAERGQPEQLKAP